MILVKKDYQDVYDGDLHDYQLMNYVTKEDIKTLFDIFHGKGYNYILKIIDIENIENKRSYDLTDEEIDYIIENYLFCSHYRKTRKIVKKDHVITDKKEIYRFFQYHVDPNEDPALYRTIYKDSITYGKNNRSKQYIERVNSLLERRIEEILKPAFHDFYGEDNVEFRITRESIKVIVKYGDTTISNLSKSHPIKDLWLMFKFNCHQIRDGYGFSQINGLRTTLTKSEMDAGYQHSHLPRMGDYFLKFCTGGSQAGAFFVEKLSLKEDNYEKLEEFLITVDHLVQFEDVINPHIKISDITPSLSPINRFNYQVRSTTRRHKNTLIENSEINLNESKSDNLNVTLKTKFKNKKELEELPDILKAVKSSDGQYYYYSQYKSMIARLRENSEGFSIIKSYELDEKFKGEPLVRKIVPDNEEAIDSEPDVCINPYVGEELTNLYENKIINIINEYVKNKKERKQEAEAQSS